MQLRGQKSLDDVLPLCRDRVKNVRDTVFRQLCFLAIGRSQVSPANRRRLQEFAVHALDGPDAEMRGVASSILREIGNAAALPDLQRALGKEANPNDKYCMEVAIAFIRKRS